MRANVEPTLDLDDFVTSSMQAKLDQAALAIRLAIIATENAALEGERANPGGTAAEWRCLEALQQLEEALRAVDKDERKPAN